jgi:hypothetical protein
VGLELLDALVFAIDFGFEVRNAIGKRLELFIDGLEGWFGGCRGLVGGGVLGGSTVGHWKQDEGETIAVPVSWLAIDSTAWLSGVTTVSTRGATGRALGGHAALAL